MGREEGTKTLQVNACAVLILKTGVEVMGSFEIQSRC